MVVTMAVRNSDSNGRSSRPQRKPMPEQTRIGATMAASSANKVAGSPGGSDATARYLAAIRGI